MHTQSFHANVFLPPAQQGLFHEDPLLQSLRTALRSANTDLLDELASEASRCSQRPETNARLAVLLMVEAAEAMRILSQPHRSEDLLHAAHAALPASSIDLLRMIKRCTAKLLLDSENLDKALTTARAADSFEFVLAQSAEPLLQGNEEMRTPETWLLVAECALSIGDYDEAIASVSRAKTSIETDAQHRLELFGSPALAAFDPAYNYYSQQSTDQRHLAHLLEVVSALQPHGNELLFDSLRTLKQHVESAECPNIPLASRIAVTLGTWSPAESSPPAGLNLNEAKRWAAFADPQRAQRFLQVVTPEPEQQTPGSSHPATASVSPNISTANPTADVVRMVAEQLAVIFDRALTHAPQHQPAADNSAGDKTIPSTGPTAGFALGGSFEHYDILAMIAAASQSNLTGYFHVSWNPTPLEEMILSNGLDETARLRQGWLFLRNGLLIDATIGDREWPIIPKDDIAPEVLAKRLQERAEKAAAHLRTILQIALASIKTTECAGQAFGYQDQTVAAREPVFDITNNTAYLLGVITKLEGGGCEDEETDLDMGGSWESTPAPRAAISGEAVVQPAAPSVSAAFLPIQGSANRAELLDAIRNALEIFDGGKVFVQLFAGSNLLGESTSQPWVQSDKLEAQDNSFHLSLADRVTLTVGSTKLLEEDLLRTILEGAGQRLRLLDREALHQIPNPPSVPDGVIIASKAMRGVYDRIVTFAPYDGLEGKRLAHILITGETGVGKEIVAREIHRLSHRAKGPWRGENLSAMPKDLVRSAIFGHVKGSFTGAGTDQIGLLQQTEGGTLLLDEFGELDLHTQALLLRMLEEGNYSPLGSKEPPRQLKTRIIFATNQTIDDDRVFRQDIKHRCSIIRVPPLRERLEDIRALAIMFAEAHNAEINEAALTWAEAQLWAGNIRQLKNLIDEIAPRAARLRQPITLEDLSALSHETAPAPSTGNTLSGELTLLPGENLETFLERIRIATVRRYLQIAGKGRGSTTRAAKLLGLARTTLVGMLQRYHINRE